MIKRIEVTDYLCNPTPFDMEEFITAQTIDGMGNLLSPEEGRMLDAEIDRLRNLAVGDTMPLGEPEAGLTVLGLPDQPAAYRSPVQETDTMAEYQIVTMNGGTGDWNPPVETFEAANDAEANTHAEEHYPELEWYILDIDGANING